MKVLVTGASGRVGSEVVARRQMLGDEVRALVLPGDPGATRLSASGVEVVIGSLTDVAAVRQAVAGVDVVVHLAAAMLWEQDADRELFSQNVQSTFNLFDAVVSQNVKLQRFFIASSDEVYPSLKALYSPIDEQHPRNPYSFYGLTKEIDERMALYYHRSHAIPVTIARFALIARSEEIRQPTGWSGRFFFLHPMRKLFAAIGRPEAVAALDASGTNSEETLLLALDEDGIPYKFQLCDVQDLVVGIDLMLSNMSAVGEVFNLSGPSPFSYKVAVEELHRRFGLPYVEVRIPGPAIRCSHDITKARSLLGYTPVYDIRRVIEEAANV